LIVQSLTAQILSRCLLAVAAANWTGAVSAGASTPGAPRLAQLPAARTNPAIRPGQPSPSRAPQQKDTLVVPQAKAIPAAEKQQIPIAAATADHDYSADIADYEQLSPEDRQQYVERLITGRIRAAAQLTLDDAALGREREIDREILARLHEGQTISPRGLIKLLRKLDTLEHAAVESLSRAYRIEVYSLFHSQRRDYDLRIAAWKKVEGEWEAHGKVPGEQRLLIDWLRAATDRLRADRLAQLPALPKFAGSARAPNVATAPPATPRLADVRPNRVPVEPPKPEPAPATVAGRHNSSQLPDLTKAPQIAVPRVPAVHAPATSARPPLASMAEVERPRTADARPLVKQPREVRLALKPVQRPADPPAAAVRSKADSLEPQAGKVDLDELAVRISGHNLALARLAGRLQDGGLWTLEQLALGVTELEDLTARRGDLMLYWELIGDEERVSVGSLHAPAAAITLLGAKISAARVAAIGHHGDQPTDAHDEPAAQFDNLSRRLAQLVGAGAKR
jgi:hypothetical protein